MVQQHVFISYRHESLEHARAVKRLGELLRQAKIPVALDQFHLDEHPGGPDVGGWPRWCEDCANESACVLIIASEGWFAEYENKGPPGGGFGVAAEARLFRQSLWDEKGGNARIRMAFLHDLAAEKVPVGLRAWHQFRPFDNDDQLNQLIRWVTSCLGIGNIELPMLRWPKPLLEFRPNLADRLNEWPAIRELLAGRSRERILLFEGPSGLGKSAIVRQAAAYARRLGISVVHLDLKGGGLDVEAVLGQFYLDLGQILPDFSREGGSKTILLRKDLRGLRQPVLVIFDTYEGCVGNQTVVDWINQQFLIDVETALGLTVIVAGQRVPDYNGARWQDQARHFALKPITEIEHWEPWVKQHHPDFQDKRIDLKTLIRAAEGKPSLMSSLFETISRSPI
jgi:SEFIR domain-containing protein